ncbi:hypothetical protein [Legionella santicrucis]|nr:hypothetical protein [Legionella santicrucis]
MELAKFLALLQNRCLYFPSLKQLIDEDPWEGLPSKLNFNSTTEDNPVIAKLYKDSYLGARDSFYVNCWHMNGSESMAQWKIYGANQCSIAIVSELERACDAIMDSKNITGGKIIYYNSESDSTSSYVIHQPFFKRKSYEHENEFRFIHWDYHSIRTGNSSEGIFVDVDVKKLIERIVISPIAPKWFTNVISSLIKDYGFDIEVNKSELLEPLIY